MRERKALSKFMILCWATFIAILGRMQPLGRGLDTPVLEPLRARLKGTHSCGWLPEVAVFLGLQHTCNLHLLHSLLVCEPVLSSSYRMTAVFRFRTRSKSKMFSSRDP